MQALSAKRSLGSVQPFTSSRVAVARPARVATVIENRVALRFQRFGRKKLPFYRLVAIDSKKRRDGEPLEYLGWYDPLKKETNLNAPAIKEWLAKGALPSETVENLLRKAYVMEPKVAKVVVPKDAVKV
ncbi:hypothetical protein HYH02_002966 [Chlamydomonas schloesseri]|uniref:30S ribosomal protein S16, chloroplastic n=1 Tax=Chlamydomonas schloesseri TaxID=2026947 RepID=A0A836BAJ4_9CHLO|nr:hypothetical protein HYH02_002966 [Chlamydomonas schloesseri]|eukprot:KAG2452736.1 hypothetical protein HYH02_002966 [Chlamydomonas schloesseri]